MIENKALTLGVTELGSHCYCYCDRSTSAKVPSRASAEEFPLGGQSTTTTEGLHMCFNFCRQFYRIIFVNKLAKVGSAEEGR